MKFGDLRGILHYVPQFRGRLFVVAIDGAVIASENFANVLLDLAVLHSLNIRLVIVHGAGHQIQALADERGGAISNADGTGVTDAATLELGIDAVSRLTNKLMQDLTAIGLRAATANAVIANPAGVIGGIDLEFTGKVDRIDGDGLKSFLDEGMVPVVAPIGYDARGGTLRINSDAAALAVAESLGASKILFLTNGEIGGESSPVAGEQLSVAEAEVIAVTPGEFSSRLASMLGFAASACRAGVDRVHLLVGARNDALLAELFSNEGVGLMVFRDDYRQIRQAVPKDVAEIVSMIRGAVKGSELLARKRSEVLEQIGDYYVLELDGNVVGTVAVHDHGPDAEVACLFIKRNHENAGHGRQLVAYAEMIASERGAERIFALSTQATGFFQRLGYSEEGIDELPADRAAKVLASGRNSKVFIKSLI
jgi:amino-acid N-acetyltransferase